MGFFGGPTDRVGDSFDFFVRPLSKLCVSDARLRVREKHANMAGVAKLIHVLTTIKYLAKLQSQTKTDIRPKNKYTSNDK